MIEMGCMMTLWGKLFGKKQPVEQVDINRTIEDGLVRSAQRQECENSNPDKLVTQITILLDAYRYLGNCSRFGVSEFDHFQDVLSRAPLGAGAGPLLKERVRMVLKGETELDPAEVRFQCSDGLDRAVIQSLKAMQKIRPGQETQRFVKWAMGERNKAQADMQGHIKFGTS